MAIFTRHLKQIGETYFQHMYYAFKMGFRMIYGGVCCVLHGIFPFICEKTGSEMAFKVGQEFLARMSEKK